jgi:hypothetical protein
MSAKKVPFMPYYMRFVLVMFILAGSLVFSTSHLAYAHTFSTSESVDFLSLVEQIRAETALVSMNLENNNVTLAQTHAEKASSLLNNSTLDEIWEVNTRIADSLETGLEQLEGNVTSLASTPQGQTPQDRIQSVNETVMTLDDLLAEAVTVRIESDQQNNATTWALVVADLVNTVLGDYGNATGSFDLTNMSNMAGMEGGMEGMQMESSDNMTTIMSSGEEGQLQMSGSSMGNDTTMTMQTNSSSASSTSNMTTTTNIVDHAAYQSAQYISNNTILQLFTETLKPLTLSANETSSSEAGNATTSTDSTAVMSPEEQSQTSTGNLTSSNIDELEARLMLLRDNVANKATPMEVMTTAHLQIHPLLMQMYGLTMAPQ